MSRALSATLRRRCAATRSTGGSALHSAERRSPNDAAAAVAAAAGGAQNSARRRCMSECESCHEARACGALIVMARGAARHVGAISGVWVFGKVHRHRHRARQNPNTRGSADDSVTL